MKKKIESLKVREYIFNWGTKTYLMGILNVTPDSFSDGGKFNNIESALDRAKYLVENGADIIDIGGQSTRPGAKQILEAEELNRVIPIIKEIRKHLSIPISIDTTRAEVAVAAIKEGADIINDISGGTFDDRMLPITAKLDVPIILMHIRGTPETMQQNTEYRDLIEEISNYLEKQINKAISLNIDPKKIIIDPGIGFAKNFQQNIELIQKISEFKKLGFPLLIGVSRKSFIGHILDRQNPEQRVWGTSSACTSAIALGADILRVHDLPEMYDVTRIADTIWR